jgi:tetratricopeptide (TPR) repeat protein
MSYWKATKTKTPEPSPSSISGWTSYETYTKNSHKYNKQAEPYAEIWAAQTSRSKMQNLLVIRCTMLGPFLFGTQTYCPAALKEAISGALLPENGLWPVFYKFGDQKKLESFTMVVEYALRALESDPFFIPFTLTDYGMNKVEAEASCIGYFQYLCNDLKESIPLPELRTYVRVVRMQLKYIIVTMRSEGCRYVVEGFMKKQQEHEDITETIKERGNKNTRDCKYRAAIADYTRAIKLSPYSETLYCNRAMCYLKCQDFWLACIDSQRAYVLKPDYDKAYYRCAEAWLRMGEIRYAAIISQMAAKICRYSSDLVKQLRDIKEMWIKAKCVGYDSSKCYSKGWLVCVLVSPQVRSQGLDV